uniref:Predicted Fe-Mo cluster-binding protein, NifX family n=1 Tax=Candidatus Kentrum sp. FM TaxID=2126340 RepID=A0A450TBZ3_9GAMM|nr:MAG: Predicted Fe-Mo cluster-binding protein, NifX family [Candidatus Kentron sp. FM]VFJ64985.1 MAG: Predicted Fe-Mo cluster-binding protein, NifX family [Candidatus Kentron sp. FM]VFK16266.1 MAG: Predicted Fe-Mo cluster-binding protein, NifX family [Candidatus Kentron sp. FM]
MKIAITSQNRREVTGHAGMCRNFFIYDIAEDSPPVIKDKKLLELPKEQSLHEHAGGQPHPLDVVNVFITGGMGSGMRQKLAGKGIRGITTAETDPDNAIRAFLDGSLVEQSPDHDCGCSGHGHGHHGHGRGQSVFPTNNLC